MNDTTQDSNIHQNTPPEKTKTLSEEAQVLLRDIYNKQINIVNSAFDPTGKLNNEVEIKHVLKAMSDAAKTVTSAANIKQQENDSKDLAKYRANALETIRAAHGISGELFSESTINRRETLPTIPEVLGISDNETTIGIARLNPDDYMSK